MMFNRGLVVWVAICWKKKKNNKKPWVGMRSNQDDNFPLSLLFGSP